MAKPRYAVELKAGEKYGAFQAGDDAVELTDDNRVWETNDRYLYDAIVRDVPFVKDLGVVKPESKKGGDG